MPSENRLEAYVRRASVFGVLACLLVGVFAALFPSTIEMRAHNYLVAQVIEELPSTLSAEDQEASDDAARALHRFCVHCSPRRPDHIPEDAPRAMQMAWRIYAGRVLDVLIVMTLFLGGNSTALGLVWTFSRFETSSGHALAALTTLVLLSEAVVGLVYFVIPVSFYSFVWSHQTTGVLEAWWVLLGLVFLDSIRAKSWIGSAVRRLALRAAKHT